MRYLVSLFLLIASAGIVSAETVRIEFTELESAFPEAVPVTEEGGVDWAGLGMVYKIEQRNVSLEEGCGYSATLDWLQGDLAPAASGSVDMTFGSLGDPVEMTLSLPLLLDLNGHVEQEFGLSAFGNCTQYAEDGFDLSVSGSGEIIVNITIKLGLEGMDETLMVTPEWGVQIELNELAYSVDVDNSLLESELEGRVRDAINASLQPDELEKMAAAIESNLLEGVQADGDQVITLPLPGISEKQIKLLIDYLKTDFTLPLNEEILAGLLARLMLDFDKEQSAEADSLLESALLCEMMQSASFASNTTALYQQTGDSCQVIETESIKANGVFYTDQDCSKAIIFKPTNSATFCANTLDADRVGDGSLLPDSKSVWTLSPGVRLDLGLVSIKDEKQPFSTSRVYKKIETKNGLCELEMRVYKETPGAENLIPLIALHGGSWQYRRNGIVGIEALAAHYSSQGFAVFAPFYRLAGEAAGPVACQGAAAFEILEDVNDALDWVQAHTKEFGLGKEKLRVTGQSAGAHLAAWLAINRASEVERALLLYPPTDMEDYLKQWMQGELGDEPAGLPILTRFLNVERDAIDLSAPVVQSNSFPEIVARSPEDFPPMFIVQGGADQLVPVRQSQRLCNSLSGNPLSGPAADVVTDPAIAKRQVITCDERGSQLHVVTEADHTLDVCLFSVLCPAGDEESQSLARDSLRTGYQWLRRNNRNVVSESLEKLTLGGEGEGNPTSGGGGSFGLMALILAGTSCYRRRKVSGFQQQVFDSHASSV